MQRGGLGHFYDFSLFFVYRYFVERAQDKTTQGSQKN